MRPIRFGDHVEKGQILAVLWSSELGEKKSEYVDALSRLRLEQETLTRLEALYKDEAIAERNLREARRNVEAAEIAVALERTLHAWRLTDEEIAAIRSEAELIRKRTAPQGSPVEKSWAGSNCTRPWPEPCWRRISPSATSSTPPPTSSRSPTSASCESGPMSKRALPTLLALPEPVRWTIRLKSDPAASPMAGWVEKSATSSTPTSIRRWSSGRSIGPRCLYRIAGWRFLKPISEVDAIRLWSQCS